VFVNVELHESTDGRDAVERVEEEPLGEVSRRRARNGASNAFLLRVESRSR